MSLETALAHWAPAFMLVLARCGGLVAFGPVLGSAALPPMLKAALAAALALAVTPAAGALRPPADGLLLAAAVAGELLVGALLGLAVRALFAGVSVAGELVSLQMGIGLPAALDPHGLTQASSVGLLLDQVAILTFLAVDGHHTLLAALARSLALVPPQQVGLGGGTLEALVALTQAALLLAVRLAAPLSAAILASLVTLGLLNRMAPQVNVFSVSFVVTMGVGLLVLLAALPVLVFGMQAGFGELPGLLTGLLAGMRRGL
ncbi:MAG: flagellar biosynthetic protein FliR [Candidatus Methylomirabilales bacterium]